MNRPSTYSGFKFIGTPAFMMDEFSYPIGMVTLLNLLLELVSLLQSFLRLCLMIQTLNSFGCTRSSNVLRATSHTRLRAHDHCTSSTLIGGEGRAGPSLLHMTLEGPTEYVNPRWM